MKKKRPEKDFEYDVCLSFAGEDRKYVDRVASRLTGQGIRVFYDRHERVELWGKDLYSHLDYVYRQAARYCVLFVSEHYAAKLWTNHERRSAQARAFAASKEYVLPARFDDTEIPGLQGTVGYVDVQHLSPTKLSELIVEKLGPRQRENYFPPLPDRLFREARARTAKDKGRVEGIARSFFKALQRMSADERSAVLGVCIHGCVGDLPKNMHIDLDLLRRVTGFPPARAKRLLTGLKSLGIGFRLRRHSPSESSEVGEVRFWSLTTAVEPSDDQMGGVINALDAAREGLCEECGAATLMRADFSQLAAVTAEKEQHHRLRRPRRRS